MDEIPQIDSKYLVNTLVELLNTPSPTGFTSDAIEVVSKAMEEFPFLSPSQTRKGALVATWEGNSSDSPRALTAHIDTLGAMVKEIKSNGRLKLSRVGGFAWNTVEGEGCKIFASGGEVYRGSVLVEKASSHVHGNQVNELKRDDDNMEVRLDTRTVDAEQTRELGIQVGDYVAFDPRVEVVNGFIRSRHLDDKACVACILAAIKALHEEGLRPSQNSTFHISNYEEVGHGAAAGFPANLSELLTVDMAAVGEGQASDEFHTTLCVKDSGGPYHYGLSQKMRQIAEKFKIPYKVDIYPYYGSDGEAYWRAGGDVAVALIGPGVDASHNYERTHQEALVATSQWVAAFLLS